ncbi:MAG TPA: molybdenum cofactor biosynthesis protein MoeB [Candidatus Omnitrophica bacterium]|nr:MAG: molybdenum cofactor biosynthesis protein MoeB [Omnitrophica WOR_2 bacterium GWF2_63_9]HAM41243.1 molybdenum cofactor biosynthesis protein MoeB [Candidatus Omnitrophota bacterium]
MTTLTRDQILRYSRHLIIPEIGVEGQEKLVQAKVLLVGAGGLGSPLGLYLAAAGVGRLGIVDFDTVDFTNLQRQIIHRTEDVGRLKVESAKERINQINPDVQVTTYSTRLTRENILDILKDYDLVIDGTDNFQTRYLVNDASVFQKKPNVYGSIFRFEGQATVFSPFKGPCYRCLFPEPPPPGMVPSCAEGGVLGVLPGIIGTIQATEGIKLITGQGEPLIGRLLLFNALKMQFRSVAIKRDPDCPVCGDHPTIKELIDYEQFCGLTRGEEGQGETTSYDIEPEEAKALLARDKNAVLLDVREPHEYDIVRIEGAKLIPLGELHLRVNELDTANTIVVHCHHGPRSQQAVKVLERFGFKKLKHLHGGIDAWATDVDPEMARY